VGYNSVADSTGYTFIRSVVIADQTRQIKRNYDRIRNYSTSRSSILVSIESAYATSY